MSQHMDALAEANRRRLAGARIKRRVAAGELLLRQALDEPDAQHMWLDTLLRAVPRVGHTRAARIQNRLFRQQRRIRVRDLNAREKDILAE